MDLTKISGLNNLNTDGQKLIVKFHKKTAGLFPLPSELGRIPKPAHIASSCSDLTGTHHSCPFQFKLMKCCHNRQLVHSNELLKWGDHDWIHITTFTDFISIQR